MKQKDYKTRISPKVENKEMVKHAISEAYDRGFESGIITAGILDIFKMRIDNLCSDDEKTKLHGLFRKLGVKH